MINEMLKVMIVDDEHLVRNLLRRCIDWNEIGMEIVAEASNASEAMELVDEYMPDIIFTDIYMPLVDGIEFSKEIIEKYSAIKIVVLTGYDEFQYAQRSIKAGVTDFLLKPINDQEIRETVLKIKRTIEKERNINRENNKYKKQLDDNLPLIKDKLLNKLIFRSKVDIEAIKEQLSYYEIVFASENFQVAAIEIASNEMNGDTKEERKLLQRTNILNILKEYFVKPHHLYIFFDNNYRLVILNNEISIDISKSAEVIKDLISTHSEYSVCIGVGNLQKGISNIKVSYEEAVSAINYRVVEGKVKKISKIVKSVQDFIIENLADKDLSLVSVAKAFFLNPSYLSRIFKKEVGVTFMEYLIKARMDKAISFFRESEMKSYEVAEAVGIVDSNYFSTCFKKYTGVSVSEYKKLHN